LFFPFRLSFFPLYEGPPPFKVCSLVSLLFFFLRTLRCLVCFLFFFASPFFVFFFCGETPASKRFSRGPFDPVPDFDAFLPLHFSFSFFSCPFFFSFFLVAATSSPPSLSVSRRWVSQESASLGWSRVIVFCFFFCVVWTVYSVVGAVRATVFLRVFFLTP